MKIPGGYAQCSIFFGGIALPSRAAITFGVRVVGSVYDDPSEIGVRVRTALTDSTLMTNLTSEVTAESVLVKVGPNATGPAAETSINLSGTAAAFTCPPNTAFLVRKNTAFGGRAGRGRFYLPGVRETAITGAGLIDGALVSAIQTDLDSFAGKLAADDLPLMLLHAEDTTLFDDPLPITSLTLQGKVATQRRRLRR